MTTANGAIEAEISDNDENGSGGSANGQRTDNNRGNVVTTDITNEMETAYLDYAMSVIVSRALPDVRDGLKPVHRRILYAMFSDLHLTSDKPHKKSARIVGEVLGKYHPHGDQAVYDAMVRMAQEFSLRYPLIDGQGNFGSIDGDSAAAMRYTEARLDQISNLMLDDLQKDTVDWHENFDSTLKEPDILPAALPNLLINGSNGIAVGMATNIPPHNLGEVVDALAYMIDNFKKVEEITVDDLMQFIQGPDFPTGGILYRFREDKKGEESTDAVAQGYATGRSRLILQAKAHFEEMSRNRNRIVVTELPYQTNKTALIERIASLVRDGKLEGITDLRDESDRTGMRIVIELTRTVDATRILEMLFKYTPLQQTFGLQMLALVDGEPIILSLRRLLRLFIEHRQEIVRRRSEYDLARAKERAHIVEGLLRALDILDEVIATIRSSQNVETARNNLVKNFDFSQIQAQAILDMQLRRLAALERKKLQDEYKELMKLIKFLEELLANPAKMLKLIKTELLQIKEDYGDARKTQIVDRTKGTLTTTDLLPDQDVWVTVGADGDLRRQNATKPSSTEAKQVGKGAGLAVLSANTQDNLYLFAKDGQCRRVSIHEIPQSGASKHASMFTEFTRRDTITAACTLPRDGDDSGYLFLVSEQGMVKRITVADFAKAAPLDPVVMNIDPKDRLAFVLRTTGGQEITMVTNVGQSIRISEEDVRSMGLAAGGVGGMKLKKGQRIIYAGVVDPDGELLTMTDQGYAKRTSFDQYSTQGRNGGGIVTQKLTSRTGDLVTALVIDAEAVAAADETHIAIVLDNGVVKAQPISSVGQMGRSVQGKVAVTLDFGTKVARIHQIKGPAEPLPNGTDPASGNGKNGTPTKSDAQGKVAATASSTGASAKGKAGVSAQKASTLSRGRKSAAKAQAAERTPTDRGGVTAAKPMKIEPTKAKATKVDAAKSSVVTAQAASAQPAKPATTSAAQETTKPKTKAASSKTVTGKTSASQVAGPKASVGKPEQEAKSPVPKAVSTKAAPEQASKVKASTTKATATSPKGQATKAQTTGSVKTKASTGRAKSTTAVGVDKTSNPTAKAATTPKAPAKKVVDKTIIDKTIVDKKPSTNKATGTKPVVAKPTTTDKGSAKPVKEPIGKGASASKSQSAKGQSTEVAAASKPKSKSPQTAPEKEANKPKAKRSAKLAAVTSVTASQKKKDEPKKAKK